LERSRHFSHFQLAVQNGDANLDEQGAPLLVTASAAVFARKLTTTSLTADSAILLLIGMSRLYRHP
jgi:hypothetical protein